MFETFTLHRGGIPHQKQAMSRALWWPRHARVKRIDLAKWSRPRSWGAFPLKSP